MRLILLVLHVVIIVFLFVHIHPKLTEIIQAPDHRTRFFAVVYYIFTLLRIMLYHSASILAIWFSRQYGAAVVRASGVLLIGELLELTTNVLQQMFEINELKSDELYFLAAFDTLLIITLLMTFRLADKLSKSQRNLMQIELLAETSGTSVQ